MSKSQGREMSKEEAEKYAIIARAQRDQAVTTLYLIVMVIGFYAAIFGCVWLLWKAVF